MRVLGPVVEIAALPVFDIGQDLALRHAIALELIGHDHARHILQALQQLLEEALGGFAIAPALHQDVEHDAVLIHRTPEIMQLALDAHEHLIHVPLVPGRGRRRRSLLASSWPKRRHHCRMLSYETTTPRAASSNST